ncbi:MAG: hypothetical protein NTU43_09885 [Bacteroidetes bacterium]|nr:hypothetical protein [Bacteroidota bacterium]
MNKKIITICILITLAALSRLLPHLPNFSPIAAIALFGGAFFANRIMTFAVPFVALIISDMFLDRYPMAEMLPVYGSFFIVVLLGFNLQKNKSILRIAGMSILSSVLFYLITNLVFIYPEGSINMMYPHNFTGMIESYTMAIPFFQNTLLGDLFYSSLLFGAYYLISINIPKLVKE